MLIQKEVLRDKIFDVLKGWILDGTLKPGERIVELTIAKQMQVSRAPLREALWLLARQGLVEIRSHHGATVTQLSERTIREIFEIREVLEIHAAKQIRRRLNPDIIHRLDEAVDALEAAAQEEDISRFATADLAFHMTLWELSGNQHLRTMLEDISTRFFGYVLIRNTPVPGRFSYAEVVEEHRRMARAITQGTDAEIQRVFHAAFAGFLEHILRRFDEMPAGKQEFHPDRRAKIS